MTVTNELHFIDFRAARVIDVGKSGSDLFIDFVNAAIIGHSCPEIPGRIPCPLNDGEDRYARPWLRVTLKKFRCPRPGLRQLLTSASVIYEFTHDPATGQGTLSFFSRTTVRRYSVSFTASSTTARWNRYGEITWFAKDHKFRIRNQKNRGDTPLFGVIDQGSHRYYTRLGPVFSAIGNAQLDYNWLITDAICYPNTPGFQLFDDNYRWLTGRELTDIIQKEDFQWIWAVLSGFPKEVPLEEVLQYPLPYADGYSGFWHNPIALQHPLAQVEIVPWDSSLVLVLSKQEQLVRDFMAAHPGARDLEEYNRELSGEN